MFPLRDDNPTHIKPVVTFLIIALNVLVWVFIQGMGSEPALSRSVCALGLIPGELLGRIRPGTAIAMGGDVPCVIGESSWLTLLSSMFMHGSWFHLIGNMWFLWVFGNNVEDALGHVRYLVFYLLCGVAAAAAQMLTNPSSPLPMVGASGAIGGVMGAYAVRYPHARVLTGVLLGFYFRTIWVPAWFMLGYWFLIQFLAGLPSLGSEEGGVAFWAHIGGFVAGVVLLYLLGGARRGELHYDRARLGTR
ncbi:MAG: rhomboid family intramembrane serine protease [Candidatus Binatia bacterium]